ncbi:MAG: hypothetical protein AB8B91_12125 [Rubripirellula sp.]
MMRRKRAVLELGHDAFLDIVANLVGILIILVVVLGTQTQKVAELVQGEDAKPSPESVVNDPADFATPDRRMASSEQMDELGQIAMRAASAQRDSLRLEKAILSYDAELEQARRARGQLLDLVTLAEEAWEDKQKSLDQTKVLAAKMQGEIDRANSQIAELAGTKERLANVKAPVVAVEHLPTPMAKTVFGDEIHFRLRDNHLSVVPLDPLIDEVKNDLSNTGSREGRSTAAVGPIRGYVAHYAVDKSVGRINSGGQLAMGLRIRVAALVIEPLEEPAGQPVDQILNSRSFLDVELAGRDPASTTITVWVYPDSFGAMRRLKEHLYQRGFATAARPLPMDRQITVSSSGSRSRAQ